MQLPDLFSHRRGSLTAIAVLSAVTACGPSTTTTTTGTTGAGAGGAGGSNGTTSSNSTTGSGGIGGTGGTGGNNGGSGPGGFGGAGGSGGTACQPSPEVCDGIDNDCNGQVDDGISPTTCGMGACQVTEPGCQNGQVPTCVPLPPAAAEACDGSIDDNCDGSVDEGCSCTNGQTMPCYSGPMDTNGVGACKAGTQTCAGGMWGSCVGEVKPGVETCNGIDDDCNDTVDDNDAAASCAIPNATSACSGGQCTLDACKAGFADCDNNPANGCEKDLSSSNDACGACGTTCPSGKSCYAGACSNTCATNKPFPFPVAGCTNVAPGKTYKASGAYLSQTPPLAADGNFCTAWNAGTYAPAWWQVDLGTDTPVRGVTLYPGMSPNGSVVHQIQTSSDGVNWTTRLTISQVMAGGVLYPFDFGTSYTARYLRITSTSSPSWISWYEVAVFSCP